MSITSREIRLSSRPVGMPSAATFELGETTVGDPGAGEVQVRNVWMTVDPYMRGRMYDRQSYVPPFQIGQALEGESVGRVVASNADGFKAGDWVIGRGGWREAFNAKGEDLRVIDATIAPPQAYLGIMGMPGFTAYAGLLRVAEFKEGDNVFVSGAAGAVGSVVGQIAKLKGGYVVGSAGSDDKVKLLTEELGFDAAVNYKTAKATHGSLEKAVSEKFPKGIDCYFENVGGEHLVTAINLMRPFGRIALCGMIDQYNAIERPDGPYNLAMLIGKGIKMQGFIQFFHNDLRPQFETDMGQWIKDGKIQWRETVYEGIEKAPEAFMGLFSGANTGKMLVRLGADD